jgi:hypothetical protein
LARRRFVFWRRSVEILRTPEDDSAWASVGLIQKIASAYF